MNFMDRVKGDKVFVGPPDPNLVLWELRNRPGAIVDLRCPTCFERQPDETKAQFTTVGMPPVICIKCKDTLKWYIDRAPGGGTHILEVWE